MSHPSLTKNTVYSTISSFCSIVFPFITLKYASKRLGAEILGNAEFARSFVSYFLLLGGVGIQALAGRNGAALRNDREKLAAFSNSVFQLNCLSALCAFSLLLLFLHFTPRLQAEKSLILVFSLEIPFSVISLEWLYCAFEDFRYIAIKNTACQAIALVILFTFVRGTDGGSVLCYAFAVVFAAYGASVLGFIRSKKYVKISLLSKTQPFLYARDALVLFMNQLASAVYVHSDVTMLGFLSAGNEVGVYSAAAKVYTAIKMIAAAILNAALPRFTFYVKNSEQEKYRHSVLFLMKALLVIVPPLITAVMLKGKSILLLIATEEYVSGHIPLLILSAAIVFSCIAMFCASAVLMPHGQEKVILKSTICGAGINIALNLILLPQIGAAGAALTTLIAEFAVSIVQLSKAAAFIKDEKRGLGSCVLSVSLGCAFIFAVSFFMSAFGLPYYWDLIVTAAVSIPLYFATLLLLKNEIAVYFLNKLCGRKSA